MAGLVSLNPTADCKLCLSDSFCSSRTKGKAPIYVGHKDVAPVQRQCSASLLCCNQWYFSKTSHHPENVPFEIMFSECLARISLAYLFCAILLIDRINRVHCKAIIHLLCNETTLHLRVSSHCVWVRGRAAWHRCWCDGLALHSHVHPYSFQGLTNLTDDLAQVSLLFRNTWALRVMYPDAPWRLNLERFRYGQVGCPCVLHKVWWGVSCCQQSHIFVYLQEQSGLLNIILKAWGSRVKIS